jgi:hypothetical protein
MLVRLGGKLAIDVWSDRQSCSASDHFSSLSKKQNNFVDFSESDRRGLYQIRLIDHNIIERLLD